MRTLSRNKTHFYYCLFSGYTEIVDEYGNATGERIPSYASPVMTYANISPATGQSNTEQFGNLENYDKVIVTDDVNCPIDENSVLFIDKEPAYSEVETYDTTTTPHTKTIVSVPAYNYIVKRVAKSLNSISIAVRKVDVG